MTDELLREKIAHFIATVQLNSDDPVEVVAAWLDPSECLRVADEIVDIITIHITERLAL